MPDAPSFGLGPVIDLLLFVCCETVVRMKKQVLFERHPSTARFRRDSSKQIGLVVCGVELPPRQIEYSTTLVHIAFNHP